VSAIIAITFILIPKPTLALYGISGDYILYVIAQYFGTAHIAFVMLLWFALREKEPRFQRFIVVSFFAGDLAGTVVLLIAQLRGLMNTSGWALVGLCLFFAAGYGYGTLNKLPEL
jgi:hypothetical protein